jgi:hypothetical protein
MEMFIDRKYDDLKSDGRTRVSDESMRRIAGLYPEAVWHRESEDSWRIVVE